MQTWNNYYLPTSVEEALQTLAGSSGPARFVAGGTDLLLDIQQGRHPPVDTLIDVTAIPDLNALEFCGDELFIGAAVPLNRIVASPMVRQAAPALVDACALIGGPQVRNTATLGGNVAHALPAGDGTIALLALGAEAEVACLAGRCRRPLEELFAGPGKSALDSHSEMLAGFWLPAAGQGEGSAHKRVMRPQGVAIAILNMAVWLRRQDDRLLDIRIGIGPAGPVPFRARATEEALRGRCLDPQTYQVALPALLSEARFRTSPHRATAEYRRQVAGVLLEESLRIAWQRAGAAL